MPGRIGHAVAPSPRQRAVLNVIAQYRAATGEACSVLYIARRLNIHHSTVQDHIEALYRKGWLRSPGPAGFIRTR